jgi:dienelactone hydrolase
MRSVFFAALLYITLQVSAALPGTKPLTREGDLSAQMVAGIDRFLMREIDKAAKIQPTLIFHKVASSATLEDFKVSQRQRLRRAIGAVDPLLPIKGLEYISRTDQSSLRYKDTTMSVHAVRWPVLPGVHGGGLLLRPTGTIRARVVAIPDADQTPEQLAGLAAGIQPHSQFARRLCAAGCEVVIPVLINRSDEFSGNARVRFTNQPHREWIYRQSFQMGRHIIGYEVLKVQALINWFDAENTKIPNPPPIALAGYSEGGLIALYTAALDSRVQATLVSGYFDERKGVWEEPIYRNVFGLLGNFSDDELASLIHPRALVVEHAVPPQIDGPPKPRNGRGGAAPGRIRTPNDASVQREFNRAMALAGTTAKMTLITGTKGKPVSAFGSEPALSALLLASQAVAKKGWANSKPPAGGMHIKAPPARQHRQIKELVAHTQQLLRFSEYHRTDRFWKKLTNKKTDQWDTQCEPFRKEMWEQVIGKFPAANLPINPLSRKIMETDKWIGYEVTLDVWQDVFAWGYLLVPKGIGKNEKRPVVVCQHGLEGVPNDVVTRDTNDRSFRYYKGFAAELADRGFITFAPHNPYRGRDAFRVLQRKANPLGRSLFSVIIAQHNRIIDWLEKLPNVDSKRIGFYGLSYGGKTAMRVPALVPRYCLSICSADFNEWIKKNTTVDARYSYMFTGEYEMFEFNLGHTYNYAEMAALIAPRPFMVERGHRDGVAPDEWVAYEFAKVRRLYAELGIPERTEIEYFNGPHSINGQTTYDFLHRHLRWPKK